MLDACVPDPAFLIQTVSHASTSAATVLHGPARWRGVARTGLDRLFGTLAADPVVVFLFALFHDAMRENDGRDPKHGVRGAQLALRLHGHYFHLAPVA